MSDGGASGRGGGAGRWGQRPPGSDRSHPASTRKPDEPHFRSGEQDSDKEGRSERVVLPLPFFFRSRGGNPLERGHLRFGDRSVPADAQTLDA